MSAVAESKSKVGRVVPNAPWQMVRLGDVAKTSSGGTPKRTAPSYYGGGIPWVKSGELGDSTVYETSETISQEGLENSSAKIFPKGTLCVALYGATVGKLGILGVDAATNQAVCGIFLPPEIDTRFAYRFLESKRRQLVESAKGGAQPNISQEIIREVQIPLPPISEQRRIVAEIEKQFTRLDAGVAALRRVQANLKRYRAAVLKAACEGRLVPTEAELQKSETRGQKPKAKSKASHGVQEVMSSILTSPTAFETGEQLLARILADRRKNWTGRSKYKEPTSPDTSNLPALPDGYAWATFGQLCRVQCGFAFKSSDYVENGVPLIRISNLVNDRVQVFDNTVFLPSEYISEYPEFLLRKGDVLIALSGATTGKMATMVEDQPALLNQRVGRFLLSAPALSNAKFVSFIVMQITKKVLKTAYGAAQPNISPSEIEEMPIPLPPLAEQKRIVAEVERRLSVIDELETLATANLTRATRLRQSILQQAFTGSLST